MTYVAMGCLLPTAVWLGVAGAFSYLLQARYGYTLPNTLGVSAFVGLFACAAVVFLTNAVSAWRKRAAIRGGIAGVRPANGPAVLVGTLQPLGGALTAPMSGAPCVTYSYTVVETKGSGKQRTIVTHFKGVGLAPAVVMTASGSFKLLTVPDLDPGPDGNTAGERIEHFERYARATSFTGPDTSAQELADRWSDADGAYRSDVAYTNLDGVNLRNCQLEQRVVPPGAQVCVFGRFSSEKGGIVPSTGLQTPPKLLVGNLDQVAAALAKTARLQVVLGVGAAGAAAGLAAAFLNS